MSNDFIDSRRLRGSIRAKYAWPGGYELVGICQDGGLLCCDCMKREYKLIARARHSRGSDPQWEVFGVIEASGFENGETCDHCYKWLDNYNTPEEFEAKLVEENKPS